MPFTRLGAGGYGVRRYQAGAFAGKVAVSHPVHRLTRLGEGGYGVRRYRFGAFAGKTLDTGGGPGTPADYIHPRHIGRRQYRRIV